MIRKNVLSVKTLVPSPPNGIKWKVHMGEDEFLKWKQSKGRFTLFFDEASKRNLGVVGAERSFLIPKETHKIPLSGDWVKLQTIKQRH
jgi:hypothetical protein